MSNTSVHYLWNEHFWLPIGFTWSDLKSNASVNYPQFNELIYSVAIGVALLFLRLFLETFVYLPIGFAFGWIDPARGNLITRIRAHLCLGFAGKSKFKRVAETAWRSVICKRFPFIIIGKRSF